MKMGSEELKILNESALFTSDDFATRRQVLTKICQTLNKKFTYGFTYSLVLYILGMYDTFHDLDIIIDVKDSEKILEILMSIGAKILPENQKVSFESGFYREAILDGVHIDIIGNFKICTYNTSYTYNAHKEEIKWVFLENGLAIPLIPIEANLIMYGMMIGWQKNRRYKFELCSQYLKENGVEYGRIFENAKQFVLPKFILDEIKNLTR